MLRRALLRTLMAAPLTGWLRPWTLPAFGGGAIEGPDAAVNYRNAFDWAGALRPEDASRLGKAATIAIDDPHVGLLLREAGPVLQSIREAAAIGRCRWVPEVISPADLCKGHLGASNLNVVRVTCLSARRHAKSGRGRDALDDVFAGLTLAHRVGAGGVLFARILECGGEFAAFDTLGRILPDLDRATLDDLSRRLGVLPPPEPASATIGPESRFILDSLRARVEAIGPMIRDSDWGDLEFDAEGAATLRRLTGGDRARLLAHLDENGPAFAELARRLDLPRPGCRAALAEFQEAERSTHPIAAGLVDAAWGIRHSVDRMRALRAILRAALVLVRDGEAAFGAEMDPFGTGGFALERRGKVSLIRSGLRDDDRPAVSLEIGGAA